MTLNFGGGLFPQRDVRETPASTATASLTGVESAISGTGVDVDQAIGDVTFTSNDGEIDHNNLANTHNMTTDIDARITAGEGIDYSAGTISGEDASTTNKGIASFNSNDFAVSTGAVSLLNKTSYWSCPGIAFLYQASPSTDDILRGAGGKIELDSAGQFDGFFYTGVNLPNGSVVTAAVVYGSNTSGSWELVRTTINGGSSGQMATAAIDTVDASITNATIDNSTYSYFIRILANAAGDLFEGARITYTTDYD